MNMRRALPNASFIGFTGTPLLDGKTRDTFGDYVSTYNFGQSVADGATVPLYYENRVLQLKNVNDDIEKQLDQIIDRYDLNSDEQDELEREFGGFYHLITREDRLDAIARDIVAHFTARGYDGKAMVVSIDKATAVRMYTKTKLEMEKHIAKLRLELSRADTEFEKETILHQIDLTERVEMAVIVSKDANEIEKMEKFGIDMKILRAEMNQKTGDGKTSLLETQFKDVDSNLRIVFVCSMWLTGFDVPNLSTLYLDKPLKDHTLMQTIARANRVAVGKKNGLIVDYIGVLRKLKDALAHYASDNSGESVIHEKRELFTELENEINTLDEFALSIHIDVSLLLSIPNTEKIIKIEEFKNSILENTEIKKEFLDKVDSVYKIYLSLLPDMETEQHYQKLQAYKTISNSISNFGGKSIDITPVKTELEMLMDKSIQAGEYIVPHYKKMIDLSKLDANALHDYYVNLENKNVQTEILKNEIEQLLQTMVAQNKKRVGFSERLLKILSKYNNETQDKQALVDNLVELARDLTTEQSRASKEKLTEEQLAVYDLLFKESLNPSEIEEVKKVAKEMIEKLKAEKLTPHWREFEPTRSGVKLVISDYMYKLPTDAYTEFECKSLVSPLYNFMYELN